MALDDLEHESELLFDRRVRSPEATQGAILATCEDLPGVQTLEFDDDNDVRDPVAGVLIRASLRIKMLSGATQSELNQVQSCVRNTPGVAGAPPLCPLSLSTTELSASPAGLQLSSLTLNQHNPKNDIFGHTIAVGAVQPRQPPKDPIRARLGLLVNPDGNGNVYRDGATLSKPIQAHITFTNFTKAADFVVSTTDNLVIQVGSKAIDVKLSADIIVPALSSGVTEGDPHPGGQQGAPIHNNKSFWITLGGRLYLRSEDTEGTTTNARPYDRACAELSPQ